MNPDGGQYRETQIIDNVGQLMENDTLISQIRSMGAYAPHDHGT